jgi:hypothetical protein
MVEAGGVGILSLLDNTQLIDFIKRHMRLKRQIHRSEVHGGYTESQERAGPLSKKLGAWVRSPPPLPVFSFVTRDLLILRGSKRQQ